MGIREHFENRKDTGDLKLSDLTLEMGESPDELKFDPRTEVSDSDWQGMKEKLEERWSSGLDVYNMPAQMRILDDAADIQVANWDRVKKILDDYRRSEDWDDLASVASSMKQVWPDRIRELGIDDEAWNGMKRVLIEHRDASFGGLAQGDWPAFVWLAADMKILRPDSEDELVSDIAWERIKNNLKEYCEDNNWNSFADMVSWVRILKPDQVKELEVDDDAWQGMRDALEEYRKDNDWRGFADLASSMTIIAAERVEMTDTGLNVVLPLKSDYKVEKKQRPVRKNF